jgi:hypothetical protein
MVRFLRVVSDMYFKTNYLLRACMLETVAAVPGMVAGISHHLRSLRRLETDNWIKILLDEAENERMHLHAFMKVRSCHIHKPKDSNLISRSDCKFDRHTTRSDLRHARHVPQRVYVLLLYLPQDRASIHGLSRR